MTQHETNTTAERLAEARLDSHVAATHAGTFDGLMCDVCDDLSSLADRAIVAALATCPEFPEPYCKYGHYEEHDRLPQCINDSEFYDA